MKCVHGCDLNNATCGCGAKLLDSSVPQGERHWRFIFQFGTVLRGFSVECKASDIPDYVRERALAIFQFFDGDVIADRLQLIDSEDSTLFDIQAAVHEWEELLIRTA